MKTLLLCDRSLNQQLLARRLHAVHPLAGIGLVEAPPAAPTRRPKPLVRIARGIAGLPLRRAWFGMLGECGERAANFPDVPITALPGVNSDQALALVDRVKPDLVLVSGTDLLRPPIIEAIGRTGRILNLHTGISPFIKGGPNCTNWALALGEFDLIGNTIMWLDKGIDSGAIITTERTPLDGSEDLLTLHRKVMDHAHDLYARAYARAVRGESLPSVPQDSLGKGRLFLSKQWTTGPILRAFLNFALRFNRANLARQRDVRLVPLEGRP